MESVLQSGSHTAYSRHYPVVTVFLATTGQVSIDVLTNYAERQ